MQANSHWNSDSQPPSALESGHHRGLLFVRKGDHLRFDSTFCLSPHSHCEPFPSAPASLRPFASTPTFITIPNKTNALNLLASEPKFGARHFNFGARHFVLSFPGAKPPPLGQKLGAWHQIGTRVWCQALCFLVPGTLLGFASLPDTISLANGDLRSIGAWHHDAPANHPGRACPHGLRHKVLPQRLHCLQFGQMVLGTISIITQAETTTEKTNANRLRQKELPRDCFACN